MSIVRMVRDPAYNNAPHTADVDEAEVDNYRPGGFVLLTEANFDVPDAQLELTLAEKQEATGNGTTTVTGDNPFGGAPLK